jgi:hypothetical protein
MEIQSTIMGSLTSKKSFPFSLPLLQSRYHPSARLLLPLKLVASSFILQPLPPSPDTAVQGAIPIAGPIASPACIAPILPLSPLPVRGEAARPTTHRQTLQVKASLLLSTCRLTCFNYLLTGRMARTTMAVIRMRKDRWTIPAKMTMKAV